MSEYLAEWDGTDRKKPNLPLCLPQIPRELTWAQTWASVYWRRNQPKRKQGNKNLNNEMHDRGSYFGGLRSALTTSHSVSQ